MKKIFPLLALVTVYAMTVLPIQAAAEVPPINGVPDGGSTLALLAVAVLGLFGVARRVSK